MPWICWPRDVERRLASRRTWSSSTPSGCGEDRRLGERLTLHGRERRLDDRRRPAGVVRRLAQVARVGDRRRGGAVLDDGLDFEPLLELQAASVSPIATVSAATVVRARTGGAACRGPLRRTSSHQDRPPAGAGRGSTGRSALRRRGSPRSAAGPRRARRRGRRSDAGRRRGRRTGPPAPPRRPAVGLVHVTVGSASSGIQRRTYTPSGSKRRPWVTGLKMRK